jgi:hypothetical protein
MKSCISRVFPKDFVDKIETWECRWGANLALSTESAKWGILGHNGDWGQDLADFLVFSNISGSYEELYASRYAGYIPKLDVDFRADMPL